jgi:hypothetical protein
MTVYKKVTSFVNLNETKFRAGVAQLFRVKKSGELMQDRKPGPGRVEVWRRLVCIFNTSKTVAEMPGQGCDQVVHFS